MRKRKLSVEEHRGFVAESRTASSKSFECPESVRNELTKIGKTRRVREGTILFRKGQAPKGAFLVLEGRVAFSSGEDPVRITRIAEEGSLLGLPATVRNKPYSLTAEAVTKLRVCQVPTAKFRELLGTNAALGLTVVNMLAEEISILRKLAVYEV